MVRTHKSFLAALLSVVLIGSVLAQEAAQTGRYETRSDKRASAFLVDNYESALGAGPVGAVRPVPALDLIATFEGLEEKPYNDVAGYCTVGYGHLIAKEVCSDEIVGDFKGGISPENARALLMADAAAAGQSASDLTLVDLTDGQYGALSSFVFNFGATKFAKSTLLKLVRVEAHDAAAEQFPRWVLARDPKTNMLRKLPGLVARRSCEAALYLDTLSTPFDRSTCEVSFGAAPSAGPLIDVAVGE